MQWVLLSVLSLALGSYSFHMPLRSGKFNFSPRRLLQVTTDSIEFSVVITANESQATQTAILNANITVEGYSSSAPPVEVLATCPANSISPVGSTVITQCTCIPGYEGNASAGSACTPCLEDTFCASGKLGLCPANAHAPALSDSILDCVCYPGFSGDGSVACSRCPANAFCTGGSAFDACTPNAVSPVQSTVNTSCYCDRGFYGVNNNPCVLCEQGSWCWTGIKNQCPADSASIAGSSRVSDCVCTDGFSSVSITDSNNQTSSVCAVCFEGVYCKVIHSTNLVYNTSLHPSLNALPQHSSFFINSIFDLCWHNLS